MSFIPVSPIYLKQHMKGLDIYKTKDGFVVAKLHYTADPEKATEAWKKETEKGYPGGVTGAAWRKEMEIDFTAFSGQLLCYHILQQYRYKIIRYNTQYGHKYGSLDWGRNNPASFHIYTVQKEKHIHSSYEIYRRDTSIPEFCELIKKAPNYQELYWISADPSMWNKNQETAQGLRSIADMFADNGINLVKGKSRDDTLAINELLDRWHELDKNPARFTISPNCPKQIWEFERLRYKQLTTAMVEKANPHEQLVDKDNHSWDDFKYFISTWLTEPEQEQEQKIQKGSVAWFLQQDAIKANDFREKYRR